MFGSLVKMNDELLPVPDLAERVDVSDDVSVYTFHLHPGITFSDGAPLTSADVVFTFERAINGETGSIWQGRLLGIEGAEAYSTGDADSVTGINAPDDQTVEITLAEPDAAFLVSLCGFSGLGILPAHVLGDVPPDQLQEHPFSLAPDVTAGPFKFVRYETDQFLELERNPEYFGDAPPLDRIFLRILTPEVGQAQLETGEINLMALLVSEVERVRELEGLRVESVPSPSLDFLAINLERPYLQSPELRQAMIHAIDREGIARQVFQGEATVMNSTIFGPEWMGIPEGLEPYPYDPELAKELLAQSGYDPNQTIEIMHIPGTQEKDAAVAIMLEQWRQVGIPAEILQVEVTELIRRYVEETDFDVLYNGGGVFRADPSISNNYFLTRNFTPNGGNGSHYSNPRVDELLIEGQATKDLDERQRIYTEIAQILNADLPWIYLWSPNSIYGLTDDLQGFAPPSYTDNKLWNAETWSISS
jgi:peptide/nickel transport system substrate-binding protein